METGADRVTIASRSVFFAPLRRRLYMIGFMKIIGRKTIKGDKTSAPKAAKAAKADKVDKVEKTAKAATPSSHPAPTHDQIAARWYEFYLARGGEHGHAAEDSARAEAELLG